MVTKDEFNSYVRVQKSGITNMFDINIVMILSDLTKEKCLDIMENYSKYKEEYK